MEFRLLGPVEVIPGGLDSGAVGGGALELGPPQQRLVLAALAVDAGRPVTLATLADRVWDATPPVGARPSLYAHIARIRGLLAPSAVLVRRAGGYLLDIDPDQVDLRRFRRLAVAARDRSLTDADRAHLLRSALDLWRGPALADLPGGWATRVRVGAHKQHLDATVQWAHAELRLGRPEEVIDALRDLAAEHPRAEPLAGALMLAYVAAGQEAEALDCYATTRQRLVYEYGTEPGPTLRALHGSILRGEHTPAPEQWTDADADPADWVGEGGRRRVTPAQLPADVPAFTGRRAELDRMSRALDRPGILVLAGTAGAGKTALAIRWAHAEAERFPDGQLYVDLRGWDPGTPIDPADALAGFLAALGVPPAHVPSTVDDRAARFRTETARRQILVVLDNAASTDQVRPLLPGASTCSVIVTSRDSLPGLVARYGAARIDVDLLPSADAVALLESLLGDRVVADPVAAAALAGQCARLPLALRVAAEYAAARPTATLQHIVAELADDRRRLELLAAGGDSYSDVRTVFSWSYRGLPATAADAFRLLATHPDPDLDPAAAARVIRTSVDRAQHLLDVLTRAHLVQHTRHNPADPGRYNIHPLLRAYATHLET
jgi:DNA-binding SARP family transcriptional activator